MWPVSARAQASLARSGDRSARVDVLRDGQVVRRIDDADPTLRLVGGSVQVDRATIRRSGSVTLLDPTGTLLPDDAADLLAPLIGEIRPWIGIRYWDATPGEALAGTDWEWVPVGTLVVTEVNQTGLNQYTVSGFDRMYFCTPFVGNWPIANATPSVQALTDILANQIPASHLAVNIPDGEWTTGALLYEEATDSGEAVHNLALSMGLAVYADPMGVVVGVAEPTTDDDPVLVLKADAGSVMMRPEQGVSAANAVNAVTFTGEIPGTSAPVRGYAEDTNPLSLTYRARVGYRPAPAQSSPLMRTSAQCELAAKTWLNRNLGLAGTLSVPIVPNPALESGDVIRVIVADQALDVTAIADSFSVPLLVTDGAQTIQFRPRVIR